MANVDIEISKSYGSDTNIVIESNNEDGSNKLIPKFGVTAEQLLEIIGDRDSKGVINRLDQSGGLKQQSFNLETDLVNGLPSADNLKNREAYFGSNIIPKDKGRTIFTMIFEAATDRLLIVLTICAFASIVLNVAFSPPEEKAFSWIDGAAIFAAVLIVISVGVGNDWTKERQFQALNKKLDLSEPCTVIRGGESYEIPQIEILVGDVVSVKAGDRIPADGLLIRSNELRIDQSGLTGESVQIGKSLTKDIVLYGSTEVREGTGTMLVIAVGHNSENGRIVALLRGGRKPKKKQEKSEASNNVGNKEKIDDNDENKNSNWKAKLNIRQRVRQYKIKKEEEDETPVQSPLQQTILQKKLTQIAAYIGYFGLVAGVLTSLVLIIQHFVEVKSWNSGRDLLRLVEILSIGITVLVVAIPEGLPLAVAISLSFSVRKMLKDHNLVRKFYSCETMGNATTICSDKTGTLTQNRMSVVKSYFNFTETPNTPAVTGNTKDVLLALCSVCSNYDSKIVPAKEEISSDSTGIWSGLKKSFSSIKMPAISRGKDKADFTQTELEIKKALPEQQGNKTECALLQMVLDLGGNYESIRSQYPIDDRVKTLEFSSERKSMSVVINTTNSQGEEVYRIFTKGASERVLDMCEYIIDEEGQVVKLTEEHRARMQEYITKFAGLALRTLLLAYRDIVKHPEGAKVIPLIIWDDSEFVQSLTCIGIVGIQDPLREEVVGSIELCKRAGITVRMITGDNVDTARAIALNCGIITSEDSEEAVMDSKEFNRRVRKAVNGKVSRNRLDEVWPTLRVLARSSPTDKYVLVDGIIKSKLNNQRQIVAVTGDGTNDGPALQRADVGFAMGIAGTAVAKGACDIILTDDNFASIVKAVMWGRNVYDSISKFLQFQLTVNVVAVTVAFISAIFNRTPLTVVQLLWVNIIMDSLASLALATEDPIPALLERKPYGRSKPLITRLIFRFIFFHSLLQLFIILSLFGAGHLLFDIPEGNNEEPTQHYTIVFNTFVLLQLVNEVNARKIHGEGNVFKGIFNNWIFWAIIIVSVLVQILVIECGLIWPPLQRVFQTNPLTFEQWLWCIFFALFELIFNQLILLYPVFLVPRLGWFTKWLKYLKCWSKNRGKEAISIAAHDEDEGMSLEPANPKELWILGIKKITTQIRVVNAFRDSVAIPQSLQDQIDTEPSEPPTPMLTNNTLRTNLF